MRVASLTPVDFRPRAGALALRSLWTLFIVAGLIGCSPTAPEEHVALTAPVSLTLHERLLPNGRALQLDCTTTEIYGCYNYVLGAVTRRLGHARVIEFTGVYEPTTCATAPGPARASLDLGNMPNGSYLLYLLAHGAGALGSLSIFPDSIVVTGATGRWITIPRSTFLRVPPGTVWGFIDWRYGVYPARAQAFLDSLQAIGARPQTWRSGDYDYFRVRSDGTVHRSVDSGYDSDVGFALRYDGNRDAIAGVARTFGDSLSIAMYGDRGETWFSWLLRQPQALAVASSVGQGHAHR